MKTKTIKHILNFRASPSEIYKIFMNSDKHTKLLGRESLISNKIGGKFSIYGGYIDGINLELEQDKKIIQKWRAKEKGWPPNQYSKVSILIKSIPNGSQVEFTQFGVPETCYELFNRDWHTFYWNPMEKMFIG